MSLMFSTASFFCKTWIIVMIVSLQMRGSSSCIKDERKGLLELKAYYNNKFMYNWPNQTDSDCCRWEGVKCDLTSGRVISLVPSLNEFPNYLPVNLSLFHPFGELQILNLTFLESAYWLDDIHGYKSLGRLKKLEVLDVRRNSIHSSVIPFLNAALSLKTLILRATYMNSSTFPILKELDNLRNLQLLDLSWNKFTGPLPGLENFHKLQRLDLSNNEFSGLLENKGLEYFHKLQSLDLSNNEFSGLLENKGLCQLKNLQELDLSQNQFTGQFPRCFDNLTQLRVLDVSSNHLNGTVPSFISNMYSIEYLSLSDNEFEGLFSFELIANLSKLKVFKLSSKSSLLQAQDGDISLQPRFQLSDIKLQNCNLEKIPSFLQHQKELRLINLSHNKLTSSFPSWFLMQNPKLDILLLQNNSFTNFQLSSIVHSLQVLDVSANEFEGELPDNIGNIFPYLSHLNLSNNGFHGNLSSSLGQMKMLQVLDLSRNNLSGNIPRELLVGCYSLMYLKLSYNKFTGHVFSEAANLTSLGHFIADNNQFSRISAGLQRSNRLRILDLSSNELRGVLPSWLGEFSSTVYLSLSNNLLEGTIPRSLFNMSKVSLMDLSRNKFSGSLPTHFNCEYVCQLFLNDNEFGGVIPDTLLENIMVLDLRNNYLSGTIPRFIGTKNIQYLLLRDNRLTGYIPKYLCDLNNINILDLANNRLNGSIPSCLNNMSFGRKKASSEYIGAIGYVFEDQLGSYSGSHLDLPPEFDPDYLSDVNFILEFTSKSRYDSYNERSFRFMSGMDLSNNELSGEIPKELGDLVRMRALNLSHNFLSGQIPKSFSNITDAESIDLSYNKLHGPIPYDLTKSNYLAVFNVSYNNLSGSIPSQGHFVTLNETNYIANPLLCGLPVNRSCDSDTSEAEIRSRKGETTVDMESFYWSLAATYSVTWIAFTVFICFATSWRQAWFRLIDAFINLFKWV